MCNKIYLVVELQNVCSFLNFMIFLFTEEMTLVFHQHKEIIRMQVVIVIFLVVNVEILGKGILQICFVPTQLSILFLWQSKVCAHVVLYFSCGNQKSVPMSSHTFPVAIKSLCPCRPILFSFLYDFYVDDVVLGLYLNIM